MRATASRCTRRWSRSKPPELDLEGRWSLEATQGRYARYCADLGVSLDYSHFHYARQGCRFELNAFMDRMIAEMKAGNRAAAQVGIDLMMEDGSFSCGSLVKCKIPRALAHCDLDESQKEAIRERVVEMLVRKYLPRELRRYAWLIRKIGLGNHLPDLLGRADVHDPWIVDYIEYMTFKRRSGYEPGESSSAAGA